MPSYSTAVPRIIAEKVGEAPSLLDFDASLDRTGGRVLTDAAMTSGSGTLNSTLGNFTPADTGKRFVVVGAAGSAVDPLIATGTYVSATQVTLSVSASATVSGARCVIVQNARAAIEGGAAAVAINGAGSLLIPDGIWGIWGDVAELPTGITIYGHGRSSIIYAADYSTSALYATGKARIAVRDLSFWSDAKTRGESSNTGAMWLLGCTDITVRNIYVDGGKAAGAYIDGCIGGEIENFNVANTKADGLHIVGGSKHLRVRGVDAYNTGDDGLALGVSYASQTQCEDLSAYNINVRDAKGRGISMIGCKDCTVDGFRVSGGQSHGIAIAYESEILSPFRAETHVPSGCKYLNGTVSGIVYADGYNALLVTGEDDSHIVDDVEIANVAFLDSNQCLVDHASNVRFRGCTVRDSTFNGLKVTNCDDVQVEDSKFKNIDESGIVFDAVDGGKIKGNDLTECQIGTGSSGVGRVQVVNSIDIVGSGNIDKRTASLDSYGPLNSSGNTRTHIEVTEIDAAGATAEKLLGLQHDSAAKQLLVETDRSVNEARYGITSARGAYFHAGDVQMEGTDAKLYGSGGAAWLMLASGFPRLSSPSSISLELNSDGSGTGETLAVKNNGTIVLNVTQGGDMYAAGKLYLGNLSTTFFAAGSGNPEGVVAAAPGSVWLDKDGAIDRMLWLKASGSGNTGWSYVTVTLQLPGDGSANNVLHLTATSPTRTYSFKKLDLAQAASVELAGTTDAPVKRGTGGALWVDKIYLANSRDVVAPGGLNDVMVNDGGGALSNITFTNFVDAVRIALQGSSTFLSWVRSSTEHTHDEQAPPADTGGPTAGTSHTHAVGGVTQQTSLPNY